MRLFSCFFFQIERYGPQHQAGSDSLLTGLTFFKLKEVIRSFKLSKKLFLCNGDVLAVLNLTPLTNLALSVFKIGILRLVH